jgi:hypothetical protein
MNHFQYAILFCILDYFNFSVKKFSRDLENPPQFFRPPVSKEVTNTVELFTRLMDVI